MTWQIVESAPSFFVWELCDADGNVLLKSSDWWSTRDAAIEDARRFVRECAAALQF